MQQLHETIHVSCMYKGLRVRGSILLESYPRELYIFLCVRTAGTAHTYQYLVVLVMSKDYTLRISYTSNIILTHKHFP